MEQNLVHIRGPDWFYGIYRSHKFSCVDHVYKGELHYGESYRVCPYSFDDKDIMAFIEKAHAHNFNVSFMGRSLHHPDTLSILVTRNYDLDKYAGKLNPHKIQISTEQHGNEVTIIVNTSNTNKDFTHEGANLVFEVLAKEIRYIRKYKLHGFSTLSYASNETGFHITNVPHQRVNMLLNKVIEIYDNNNVEIEQ